MVYTEKIQFCEGQMWSSETLDQYWVNIASRGSWDRTAIGPALVPGIPNKHKTFL